MKKSKNAVILFVCFALILSMALLLTACGMFPSSGDSGSKSKCKHDYVEDHREEAGCATEAKLWYRCTKCRNFNFDIIGPATGEHNFSYIKREDPTCLKGGFVETRCSSCLLLKNRETLDPLGHDLVDVLTPATCEEDGEHRISCTRCDYLQKEELKALGHHYVNGVCTNGCGDVLRFTVTFDSNGGDELEPLTVTYGHILDLPIPTRLGFTFVGWFNEVGDQVRSGFEITKNLSLIAKWGRNSFISTPEDLVAIKDDPEGSYQLTCDLDMRGLVWTPIDEFKGILDGQGYTIKNIAFNTTEVNPNFGFIRVNKGTIKNLTISDFSFSAMMTFDVNGMKITKDSRVGVLTATNFGTIENVNISRGSLQNSVSWTAVATFTSHAYFGTFAGFNEAGGEIYNCASTDLDVKFVPYNGGSGSAHDFDTLNAFAIFGGLIGQNEGSATYCSFEGNLTLTTSIYNTYMYRYVTVMLGGLVGQNDGGEITNSSTDAFVTTSDLISTGNWGSGYAYYERIGNFVGVNTNKGKIKGSFALGSIENRDAQITNDYIGGFVGLTENEGEIDNCYASVNISSFITGELGGFAGRIASTVQNSYSTGYVNLQASGTIGGFVGNTTTTGSISKCISYGDVTLKTKGNAGYFAGGTSGIFFKCYVPKHMKKTVADVVLNDGTENSNVFMVGDENLFDETFLKDNLFWDSVGWLLLSDSLPILAWDVERNHNFLPLVVDPTCEQGGFTIYTCDHCHRYYVRDFKDPLGHAFSEPADIPPCFDGTYKIDCSRCGISVDKTLDNKLPHTPEGGNFFLADCVTTRTYFPTCSVCHLQYSVVVEPIGHKPSGAGEIVKPSSCIENGEIKHHCLNCDQDYILELELVGHTFEEVGAESASCVGGNVKAGHTAGLVCSVCGYATYRVIEPHNFGSDFRVITNATCSTDGLAEYSCSLCGMTEERVIPQTGHIDRNKDYICDVCNQFTFSDNKDMFVQIQDVYGLLNVKNDLTGYYMLMADIDLSNVDWTPIGTELMPFSGIFFGNGYKISGLKVSKLDEGKENCFGLFGYNVGTIIGLKMENVSILVENANGTFGAFVAVNAGKVVDCQIIGNDNYFSFLMSKTMNKVGNNEVYVMSVTAGAIVGKNEARGMILGCSINDKINAEFFNVANVDVPESSTIWSAMGSWFSQLISNTSLKTTLNVNYGNFAGENAGTISECTSSAETAIHAYAIAELEQMRGKSIAHIYMNAGSLAGVNKGSLKDCSAKKAFYDHDDAFGSITEMRPDVITGKTYQKEILIANYAKTESGKDGFVGFNGEGCDCFFTEM